MFNWKHWILIVCLSLAAACATNPVTGKKELVLVSETQEIEMGLANAQQVDQEMGLYDDPELAQYVSDIGMRLARASERPDLPWKFEVVDSPVVNAFALPGGPIYLTRGILAHMNNEAAMVGVLGHEIGHTTSRHIVQQISRSQLANIGLTAGMVFFPEVQPYGDLIGSGLGLLFLKFGRDDEHEADMLGVRYSLAAGYDSTEMATFFDVLTRMGEQSGNAIPGWMSTHPDPEDRQGRIIRETQARAAGRDLMVRNEEFLRQLEGLIYGEDPRQGFVDGNRFKHPDLKFQLDFPEGWNIRNTRQAVFSAPPDGSAAIQLTASGVPSGTRPEVYAQSFFRQQQLEYGTGERMRVGQFPAYSAPYRARTSSGTLYGEAGFVVDGELVYEIFGMTRESSYRRYRDTFLRVIASYDRLRDRKALDAEPLRIRLYRVPESVRLEEALERAGADGRLLPDLALVNNLELGDVVEAGTLLKIAGRGGSR
jgi:predicted Zn-dependent protease